MNILGPVPLNMSTNCRNCSFFSTNSDSYFLLQKPSGVINMPRPARSTSNVTLLMNILPVYLKDASNQTTPTIAKTNSSSVKEYNIIMQLRDLLLNKMLVLDPARRLNCTQVLSDEVLK
jgi:hypothetical protein